MKENKNLVVEINEKPKPAQWFFLSVQHVFAMFGATILVPFLTGMPISVALFASGIGTFIYIICTKGKVPVYLGSSFAYISAVVYAKTALGGDISAAQTGLMIVGLVYVVVAIIIHFIGKDWLDKLLPPIVIGPMIAIIGLGLAPTAVAQAGLDGSGSVGTILVAVITFVITASISRYAKGFLKIVPFLFGIVGGYLATIILSQFGLVEPIDFTPVVESFNNIIQVPAFAFPFKLGNFTEYKLYFGPETWAIIPIAFVTISEHIGDHTVLGKICGKNFLKEPGLDKTLIGDGIATSVSALIGGPANTTYGENTGVIGMTKVGSVYVIGGAAVFAILMSFFTPLNALISTIPSPVLGGMSILLFGVIASNGLRVLVDAKVDFGEQKNLIIASAMLVIGLGGAVLKISDLVSLQGMALAAVVGIVLNLALTSKRNMIATVVAGLIGIGGLILGINSLIIVVAMIVAIIVLSLVLPKDKPEN